MGRLLRTAWCLVAVVACAPNPAPEPAAPATLEPETSGDAAGAEPDDRDPSPDGERERVVTVAEAEQWIGDTEGQLDGLLSSTTPDALGTSRCVRLCRSLGSMRRAVDSLCELTGESEERCERARERLENNRRRVSDAGCSC